jgi:hypothetical protein
MEDITSMNIVVPEKPVFSGFDSWMIRKLLFLMHQQVQVSL